MKKILVPIDFSDHTEVICSYATELARLTGGDILLFHTYFDQFIIADSSFPDTINVNTIYNEELLKEVFHQAERNLAGLKTKVTNMIRKEKIENVTVDATLAGGEIEPELRAVCNIYKPDYVVMGSTGKGNTLNVWGKVSTYIIDHAKTPVFIIPRTVKKPGFGKIMLASDLTGNNEKTIRRIFEIFAASKISIYFTHFIQKEKNGTELPKVAELKKIFEKEQKEGRISFNIVETGDDQQEAINSFINGNKISLIAFQPHRHGFFYMLFTKNITKKNLFAANIPLLALPVSSSNM